MELKLTNNTDKKCYTISNLTDKNTKIANYVFDIQLPEMPDGEYTYTLTDGTATLAEGLMQVGEYNRPTTAYTGHTPSNGFIQYNG